MGERVFIKGFDEDLKCRGYQFEVGKEYKIDLPDGYTLTTKDLCSNKVFHFCDAISKVHEHYNCANKKNRYCIIEVLGQICDDGNKCGSNHIKIVRELIGEELKIAKGLTGGNAGLFNSGNQNSGDRNSGDRNSGDQNSGDQNSGDQNSGYRNSGYRNSGNRNSGYRNSGDQNSGDQNSGIFNKTNGSNGVFCNIEPKICIFNIQTDWTLKEFYNSKYYAAIISSDFPLTEWVYDPSPAENGVDGKLVVNSYEDACRRWWKGMSQKNKEIIKEIPNFNIEVFCDITGIDKKDV
jgi:hypothetical protein